MIWSDYYWIGLLALTFGTAVPVNLFLWFSGNKRHDLIRTMWRWTSNDPLKKFSWPLLLLGLFMTWLTLHLTFGFL